MTSRNVEEVKESINKSFEGGSVIISIDGWSGSGKSYLSNMFNESDNIEIIHLDSYINKNQGLYLEEMEYDNIKNKFEELLESKSKILVEGDCVLKILDNIGFEPNNKVYVKELGILNGWYYERYLDENKEIEEIFQEDDEEMSNTIPFEGMTNHSSTTDDDLSKARKGLFYDLVRYHRDYKPHESCDVLFERKENV
jgi:hypothetical protein